MSIEPKNASTHGLPSYLGLATLDPATIQSSENELTASYLFQSDLVYQVGIQKEYAWIKEYYGGQVIQRTMEPGSLMQAFLKHFSSTELYSQPRLGDVFQPIMKLGNIYVNLPNQPSYVYYPGGLVLRLKAPLDVNRRQDWQSFKKELEANQSSLKLEYEGDGYILYLTEKGQVKGNEVLFLEFTTLLIDVMEVASLIVRSGLIAPLKEYRLVVTDAAETGEGSLPVYLGDHHKGFYTFSVVRRPKEMSTEALAQRFYDVSIEFMDSLSQKSQSPK